MTSPGPYRLTGDKMLQTIENWDKLIDFRVQLIACGGTALTLLKIKKSTKDIDLIVPVTDEYKKLMKFVKSIGYQEKGGGWETHFDQRMASHLPGGLEPRGSDNYKDVSRHRR